MPLHHTLRHVISSGMSMCHFLCRKCVLCTPKGPFSPKFAPNRRSRWLSFLGGGAREKASDFCEKVEITAWYTKVVQLFAARPLIGQTLFLLNVPQS